MNTKRPNKITFRLSDEENSDLQAKIKDSGLTEIWSSSTAVLLKNDF